MQRITSFPSGYALTKFVTGKEEIRLEIDIRYAIPHHGRNWDGTTWCIMEGDSQFKQIFDALVSQFSREYPGLELKVTTRTIVGPDIKNYDSPQFVKIREAYKEIIGQDSPLLAMGGGTDAKGYPELIAAGPLFTDSLGPPVNYHGINEGVPLEDLKKSAKILYTLLVEEVSNAR